MKKFWIKYKFIALMPSLKGKVSNHRFDGRVLTNDKFIFNVEKW